MSLISFPKGTSKAISAIADVAADIEDSFTLVGFGLNPSRNPEDGSSAGVIRIGYKSISHIGDGLIQFTGQSKLTAADGSHAASSIELIVEEVKLDL